MSEVLSFRAIVSSSRLTLEANELRSDRQRKIVCRLNPSSHIPYSFERGIDCDDIAGNRVWLGRKPTVRDRSREDCSQERVSACPPQVISELPLTCQRGSPVLMSTTALLRPPTMTVCIGHFFIVGWIG
jgi:hypothetical protein